MNRTTWYRQVYLKSPHWRDFSRAQLKKRLICEECRKAPATDLHHRRYYLDNGESILGRERPSDMSALCRPCHESIEQFKRKHRKAKNLGKLRYKLGSFPKIVRDWLNYQ